MSSTEARIAELRRQRRNLRLTIGDAMRNLRITVRMTEARVEAGQGCDDPCLTHSASQIDRQLLQLHAVCRELAALERPATPAELAVAAAPMGDGPGGLHLDV